MKKIQKELFLIASVPSLIFIVFATTNAVLGDGPQSSSLVTFFIFLSIAATLTLGFRIQSLLIKPLEETISGLNKKSPAVFGSNNLRELSLAVDTCISHLEREFDDKQSKSANEIMALKRKCVELERQSSDILDSYNSLDHGADSNLLAEKALQDLCLTTLKTIIGFTNRIINAGATNDTPTLTPTNTLAHLNSADFKRCLSEITQAAKSLVFLIQETGRNQPSTVEGEIDPWQIADDVLSLLGPIINHHHCNISVKINTSCPTTLTVATEELKSILFHYLLHYFLHKQFLTTHGQEQNLVLEISYAAEDKLIFAIDNENYPASASARLTELNVQGITLEDGSVCLPAKPVAITHDLPADGLNGIIVCDDNLQRASLHSRLTQLGALITEDFKTTKLDFCIVEDETGEAFKAIQQYLKSDINILLLNNKTLYQRPNWHQLRHPLDQAELKQLLEVMEPTVRGEQSYNVLAVDDNESNLRLLELQLKELGHSVTTAADGRSAVNMCNAQQFDLIFLDILMPGMGGLEAARLIHDLQVTAPPIVGLTAHVTNDERLSYLAAGMSEVIVKPIRMEKLKSVLHRQINLLDTKPALAAARITKMSIFDQSISLSVANKRPELADEFLQILVSNLAADQEQINNAFRLRDHEALKRSVHKLNGAVKYCGVPRLANAIDKLESIVKTSDEDHTRGALTLLNSEVSSLMNWYDENPKPFGKPSDRAENT